ncbi:MAG: hypothetical protein A2V90_04050 [Gammaproteobacteria bacterium RBG_16_57_12]|nr:MAG: hypothetical protein A2V90_04050 [Gammaproteobacteria bacterium RBG_16_57_12]
MNTATAGETPNPHVILQTTQGSIELELYPDKAPKTVANFLTYVKEGHYDGTVFHRVISDFMIQGGGFTTDLAQKKTHPPVVNEAGNGLKNSRGTLAMARTPDPHSASAQFFINVVDNDFLNFTSPHGDRWGYCVFGKVVKGMEVVDQIRRVRTRAAGPFPSDVPVTPVIIEKATLVEAQTEAK